MRKFVIYFGWCLAAMAVMQPCGARADAKGEQMVERADSLYGVQQYKDALLVAREALPLTKGTPNFTRAFKKTFGITPTQYLDRQKDA